MRLGIAGLIPILRQSFIPEQNYVWVYDAENNLIPNQRIPISADTTSSTTEIKSLFAKDGGLYRYDTTVSQTLLQFPLDWLRLPEPKSEIYPILAAPGDSIDLSTLISHADTILFDVGFEKPSWLSIDGTQLKDSGRRDTEINGVCTIAGCESQRYERRG